MGFVGLLKLLVTSFDVLGWPVITIVYPLYASIQAIQTNSHFENRRWLTYWVLCGLIMIFELICARFIGWFPFWPQVKLMTTCWLAIPHFDGAGYAYNHFVRPFFSVNLQTVKNLVRPGQEEFHVSGSDNFLLVAERYIQEKGSEGLEKLIFDMVKCKEPNYSKEENTFKDDMNSEEAEKFDKVDLKVPIPIHTDCKSVAIAEKELLLGSELEDGRTAHCGSSVLVNAQKEWTCALCQVCTSSELILQKHIQGKKHKAKEKEIERTMAVKNSFTSTSNSKRTDRLKVTQNEGLHGQALKDKPVMEFVENSVGVTKKKENNVGVAGPRDQSLQKSQSNVDRVTQNAGLHGQALKDKPVKEFVENSVAFTKKKENSVGFAGARDRWIQKSQSNADRVTQNAGLHGQALKDKPVKELLENSVGFTKKQENSVGVAGARDHSIQKSQSNADRITQNAGLHGQALKGKPVKEFVENSVGVTQKNENSIGVAGSRDQSIQKSQSNADRVTKPSKLWCNKCKIKCSSSDNLLDHFRGKKHLARLQEG